MDALPLFMVALPLFMVAFPLCTAASPRFMAAPFAVLLCISDRIVVMVAVPKFMLPTVLLFMPASPRIAGPRSGVASALASHQSSRPGTRTTSRKQMD
eukprot:1937575-Rhodomonas_salina.1